MILQQGLDGNQILTYNFELGDELVVENTSSANELFKTTVSFFHHKKNIPIVLYNKFKIVIQSTEGTYDYKIDKNTNTNILNNKEVTENNNNPHEIVAMIGDVFTITSTTNTDTNTPTNGSHIEYADNVQQNSISYTFTVIKNQSDVVIQAKGATSLSLSPNNIDFDSLVHHYNVNSFNKGNWQDLVTQTNANITGQLAKEEKKI